MALIPAFRFACRRLGASPGSSLLAVLALGLGIGLTTAAFSLLDAVFLRGLPLPEGVELMRLEKVDRETAERGPIPLGDFVTLRRGQTSFAGLSAFLGASLNIRNLTTAGAVAERTNGALVTADLFQAVEARAFLGRPLQPGDGAAGAPAVVVLGHDLWRRQFGGDKAVVGRPLRVEGILRTIVGVMPEGFGFPLRQEIWIPLALDAGEDGARNFLPLQVFGRLRPGVSPARARGEMSALAAHLPPSAAPVGARGGAGLTVTPYAESYTEDLRPGLRILLVAAIGVLAIACLNVTNLLLARAVRQWGDLAVQTAVGARRQQLIGGLLLEAGLLGSLGTAVGWAVARGGVALYLAAVGGELRSYWMAVRLDGRVLLFAIAVAALASLACGLGPAWRAAAISPARILQESRALAGRELGRLTRLLVILEIALGAALLVALGLAVQSFYRLRALDPGFAPERIVAGQISLSRSDYPGTSSQQAFYDQATARLRALPGVADVAWASSLPGGQVATVPFRLAGAAATPGETAVTIVSPRYFATLGRRLLAGRDFQPADAADAPPVAVINRSFLLRHFPPGADPVGRRIQWGRPDSAAPWLTIIGVAPDLLVGPVEGGSAAVGRPALYVPLAQNPSRWTSLLVRAAGEPLRLAPDLRRAIAAVDANLPLFWIDTMTGKLAEGVEAYRAMEVMVSVFGLAALALAALGIYSVMALAVDQRQGEFGLRMAVGALRRQIAGLVLRRGLGQLLWGFLLGLPLAVALGRALAAALYGVRPVDLVSFAAAASTLGAAGLAASLVPALRAARLEPAEVLRRA